MGGGATITALNPRPQSAETGALRTTQFEEVAKIYGIPPPLLGMQVSTWGSGMAELGKFAWRFALRHHTDRFLAGFERALLPVGMMFYTDTTDLTRGDSAVEGPFVASALGGPNNPGYISREEARHRTGFPRDVDGELIIPCLLYTSPSPRD